MTVIKITDHVQRARDRLITQYQNAPKLEGILDAFSTQFQDMENAAFALLDGRFIENAEGKVLDDFGTIVGQDRLGLDDTFYRVLIYAKIGENISQGETERVIDVYKIITRATRAELQEHFPAGMILLSDGEINPITAEFVLSRLQNVTGAGIRIDNIGKFSATNPFGFQGAPGANGFGTLADPLIGGEFSRFYDTSPPFGFFGVSGAGGFGTLDDPYYGGKFTRAP